MKRITWIVLATAPVALCASCDGTQTGGHVGGGGLGNGNAGATSTVGGATSTVGGATSTVGGATSTVGGATSTVGGATSTVGGATSTVGGATSTVGGATSTVGGATSTIGGATSNAGGTGSSSMGTITCSMKVDGAISLCVAAPGTASDCVDDPSSGLTATLVSSCPAGALLDCQIVGNGQTGMLHVYDAETVDALNLINPADPCAAFAE